MTTATMPYIFEDVDFDLEELFDKSQACQCTHQASIPGTSEPCDRPAVAVAVVENTCMNEVCPFTVHRGVVCEWRMCAEHLRRAAEGTLKCGWCRVVGGYKLVFERPL